LSAGGQVRPGVAHFDRKLDLRSFEVHLQMEGGEAFENVPAQVGSELLAGERVLAGPTGSYREPSPFGQVRFDRPQGRVADDRSVGRNLDDLADGSDPEDTPEQADRPGTIVRLDVQVTVVGPQPARLAGGVELVEDVAPERPLEFSPDGCRLERQLAVANENQSGHEESL
jgi:hypothetical protein